MRLKADLKEKSNLYQYAMPYVPVGDQSSGVTVGYGYDLGQQSKTSNIPARLRAMKRLWSNQPGLIKRREGEAKLIESDLRGETN